MSNKIKTLEDKLFESIQRSGLKHRDRSPEEALSEALANTTPKHPGTPNIKSYRDDPPDSEWI